MTKKTDYQHLSVELDNVLAKLQAPDIQVDQAVSLYEQGMKLVAALEAHISQAENKLKKLKATQPSGDNI
jgi:exodeoxyribonuclease VII small subunit